MTQGSRQSTSSMDTLRSTRAIYCLTAAKSGILSRISIGFKPHTNSKLFELLELTLRDPRSRSHFARGLLIAQDYIIFPWMWQVSRGSWNLKEFVGNLVRRKTA